MTVVSQAETWFLDALKSVRSFSTLIRQCKAYAFDAGLLLASAKAACSHGQWEQFFEKHSAELSLRSAQRFMKFSADCLTWAKINNPRVTDQRQLQSYARDMVLESALSFMELCREVGAIKARAGEGARDGKIDPASRQLQFHFNFDAFDGLLLAVEQSGGSNPFVQVDKEELAASRARAARVLALMDAALISDSPRPAPPGSEKILPHPSGPTLTQSSETAVISI